MKNYSISTSLLLIVLTCSVTQGFTFNNKLRQQRFKVFAAGNDDTQSNEVQQCTPLDPSVAKKFKVITCMSSACAERSATFGIDQYALYSGMYVRKEENGASEVQVEEGPCMGRCRFGPCITIEHEDYEGRVALEGMEDDEFAARVFQT